MRIAEFCASCGSPRFYTYKKLYRPPSGASLSEQLSYSIHQIILKVADYRRLHLHSSLKNPKIFLIHLFALSTVTSSNEVLSYDVIDRHQSMCAAGNLQMAYNRALSLVGLKEREKEVSMLLSPCRNFAEERSGTSKSQTC